MLGHNDDENDDSESSWSEDYSDEEEENWSEDSDDLEENLNEEVVNDPTEPPYDSPFFHLDYDSLKITCDVCHKFGELFMCSSCKIAYYCSKTCQRQGWKRHKSTCSHLKGLQKDLDEQESLLRIFHHFDSIHSIGKFWLIPFTQDYCKIMDFIIHLCHFMDHQSIGKPFYYSNSGKQALKYSMKLLYYDRLDHSGVGIVFVNQLLMKDKDQCAYDYLKFRLLMDDRIDYTQCWVPYLHYWQEDLSEDMPIKSKDAGHLMALTLLKFRYFDLCVTKEQFWKIILCAMEFSPNHPLRKIRGNDLVLHHIYSYLVPSGTFNGRSIRDSAQLWPQIENLLNEGYNQNKFIWIAILDPKWFRLIVGTRSELTPSYSPGTIEEAKVIVESSFVAWCRPQHILILQQLAKFCYTKLSG